MAQRTQPIRCSGSGDLTLSVIPWVAEHPDGALIDDIVERYAYPRAQLLDDLQDVVFFVGVHPFTPDSLIEVDRVAVSGDGTFGSKLEAGDGKTRLANTLRDAATHAADVLGSKKARARQNEESRYA